MSMIKISIDKIQGGVSLDEVKALKNDAEKNDSLTSEENEYKYQINGKQAKDIGVVPGHRFEDEQGGIWEKGEDGKFYKQD